VQAEAASEEREQMAAEAEEQMAARVLVLVNAEHTTAWNVRKRWLQRQPPATRTVPTPSARLVGFGSMILRLCGGAHVAEHQGRELRCLIHELMGGSTFV
jgi:hypothetical protein